MNDLIQYVANRSAMIATKAALDGNPLQNIFWIPPRSASDDYHGTFVVEYYEPKSSSNRLPWEI